MARKDELTNQGPMSGNKRSHALNASRRKWNLNLQTVTITNDDNTKSRVRISAKTKRTLQKNGKI